MGVVLVVAVIGLAGPVSAQTAGGPVAASPGAMPPDTPLTSTGSVRHPARATPATPAAIGPNKPAQPANARRERAAPPHSSGTASQ